MDLSYLLGYGGVFKPLRDPAYFAQLRADVEAGTIVWPNDADIAPETLYAQAQCAATATGRAPTKSSSSDCRKHLKTAGQPDEGTVGRR